MDEALPSGVIKDRAWLLVDEALAAEADRYSVAAGIPIKPGQFEYKKIALKSDGSWWRALNDTGTQSLFNDDGSLPEAKQD